MNSFTLEDLVSYIYNEMPSEKKHAIEEQLAQDWTFNEKYKVLKESYEKLGTIKLLAPRKQSIRDIMQYAAAVETVQSN